MEQFKTEYTEEELVKKLSGKLLLRSEIRFADEVIRHLLKTSSLEKTPSMVRRTFGYICQRCANQKPSLIGMFPCALCKETHAYCRHCLQMGRTMSCEPLYYWTGQPVKWPMHDDPCQWDG